MMIGISHSNYKIKMKRSEESSSSSKPKHMQHQHHRSHDLLVVEGGEALVEVEADRLVVAACQGAVSRRDKRSLPLAKQLVGWSADWWLVH